MTAHCTHLDGNTGSLSGSSDWWMECRLKYHLLSSLQDKSRRWWKKRDLHNVRPITSVCVVSKSPILMGSLWCVKSHPCVFLWHAILKLILNLEYSWKGRFTFPQMPRLGSRFCATSVDILLGVVSSPFYKSVLVIKSSTDNPAALCCSCRHMASSQSTWDSINQRPLHSEVC